MTTQIANSLLVIGMVVLVLVGCADSVPPPQESAPEAHVELHFSGEATNVLMGNWELEITKDGEFEDYRNNIGIHEPRVFQLPTGRTIEYRVSGVEYEEGTATCYIRDAAGNILVTNTVTQISPVAVCRYDT